MAALPFFQISFWTELLRLPSCPVTFQIFAHGRQPLENVSKYKEMDREDMLLHHRNDKARDHSEMLGNFHQRGSILAGEQRIHGRNHEQ